jgi:hypothetical protein
MVSIVKKLTVSEGAILELVMYSCQGGNWLEVSLDIIRGFGIADAVSEYSYMTLKNAYLEEGEDMNILIESALQANVTCKVEHLRDNERELKIRGFGYFNPELIKNPLHNGAIVELHQDRRKCQVITLGEKNILLQDIQTKQHLSIPSDSYSGFIYRKVG